MFQKSKRLRNNEEVLKTIKKGVNLKTPFFNVKYLKTNNNYKITVVVSKKISKLAVSRNRVKRIFRAEIINFLNIKSKDNPGFQLK
jgi:ribonuclease P protein component